MNDLEITKRCAEMMGYEVSHYCLRPEYTELPITVRWQRGDVKDEPPTSIMYDPLHDDAQAMALVKKFGLALWGNDQNHAEWKWHAEIQHFGDDETPAIGHGDTANLAICECVAQLEVANG